MTTHVNLAITITIILFMLAMLHTKNKPTAVGPEQLTKVLDHLNNKIDDLKLENKRLTERLFLVESTQNGFIMNKQNHTIATEHIKYRYLPKAFVLSKNSERIFYKENKKMMPRYHEWLLTNDPNYKSYVYDKRNKEPLPLALFVNYMSQKDLSGNIDHNGNTNKNKYGNILSLLSAIHHLHVVGQYNTFYKFIYDPTYYVIYEYVPKYEVNSRTKINQDISSNNYHVVLMNSDHGSLKSIHYHNGDFMFLPSRSQYIFKAVIIQI